MSATTFGYSAHRIPRRGGPIVLHVLLARPICRTVTGKIIAMILPIASDLSGLIKTNLCDKRPDSVYPDHSRVSEIKGSNAVL